MGRAEVLALKEVIKNSSLGYKGNKAGDVGDNLLREIDEFEKGFPDGVFVDPKGKNEPKINFRALSRYCSEKGVRPADLTETERAQFIIRDK
ncbi:hypothetical protein ABFV99_13180 [Cytobacillus horneckiae]|uniref:hypothetical protein n=1 Tax=Cytobacillus horneckiae TaxID=549687 RepID=UPI0034CEE42A